MKLTEGIIDILLDKLMDYILDKKVLRDPKMKAHYEKLMQSSDQYNTAKKNIQQLNNNLQTTLDQYVDATKNLIKARDEYADKYGEAAALRKYPMIKPR